VLTVSSLAYFASTLAFAAYNWRSLRPELARLPWSFYAIAAATSVITGFLANLLYFYILKDNDSYIVAALTYSAPVFTLVLAYLFLNERMTVLGVTGVLLIVLGVVAVAFNESAREDFFFH
jgi:drug/metabolite transporter (DMT)-like permease